jgi:hypothetical protein
MGSYGDDRYGSEGWRERDRERHRDHHPEQGRGGYGRDGDDRGFLDRAGDEVRSWFGDDDAQHRREMDQRRWEREQHMTGRRDNDSGPGTLGGGGFGGGWGNQAGESWNRERPGARSWSGEEQRGGGERHYARGEREGWFSDSRGGERGERYGGFGGGYGASRGRRNRHEQEPRGGGQDRGRSEGFGGDMLRGQGSGHDPHYSEWRRRQIDDLDRDYDEWRREHQSRFEQEFASWRAKRQGQRQSLGEVAEHMEVVGSDGSHIGTVDKVRGDRIILTKADPAAGGIHHSVPCSWVERVEDRVTLNRTADEAKAEWRGEERNQALFDRDEQGRGGPRNLDRAFSGTYEPPESSRGEGGRGEENDRSDT